MHLVAEAARGHLAEALAEEGGMPSALWAGQRKKGPVRMSLTCQVDDFTYEISFGLPSSSEPTVFRLDPEIKSESVALPPVRRRPVYLLERDHQQVWVRDREGNRAPYSGEIAPSQSALFQVREPHLYPELAMLRQEMSEWRFYHHFSTDAQAPARTPQYAVRTLQLSNDGHDLAAALQTIIERGGAAALFEAVQSIMPGAKLHIDIDESCRMAVQLATPGIGRYLSAQELSDGTLRFLYLCAALLSPSPPRLIALNEPEVSIHRENLEPLARLIVAASAYSQMWIVTHSTELADHIARLGQARLIQLHMVEGETLPVGASGLLYQAEDMDED